MATANDAATIDREAPVIPGQPSDDETLPTIGGEEVVETEEGGDDPEGGAEGEAEDFEDIEIDGELYSVPKKLRGSFLMQSDYTRKTQEVADAKRNLEAREAEIKQQAEALQQDAEDRARGFWLEQQIAPYAKMTPADWSKFEDDDPVGAQKHWRYFQTLKDQRGEVATRIEKNARERAEKADADLHNRAQEAMRVVARDIKGWGPELARQLTEYGLAQGFTLAELQAMNTNARDIKLLHKSFERDQLVKKQEQAARRGPAAQQRAIQIKPLATVSRRQSRPAATAAPTDKDDDETWLKKRRAQLAKQKG